MKKTGKSMCISGQVSYETADFIYTDGGGTQTVYFQNVFQDERKGYAYKVSFASMFPDVTVTGTTRDNPFAIQTFSKRELSRFTDTLAGSMAGYTVTSYRPSLASNNRTIGIVGGISSTSSTFNHAPYSYQTDYVIKGDAMVTQSISLAVNMVNKGSTDSMASYYIELDEYKVDDDEEIMLILNERSQGNSNRVGTR
tara:strand:- start:438 stop:1028 length:591 start_codon:yes stop_codon:yes gene_type:complete